MFRRLFLVAWLTAFPVHLLAQAPLGPSRRGGESELPPSDPGRPSPAEFIRQFHTEHWPESLNPQVAASELEQERAHSLALFGKARLKQQREEYGPALQAFQRAYQWNPSAASVLWEIVPLAFHLDRQGEAIRYATLANERLPRDPELIQQLAMMLAADDDYARALNLLDAAIRIHQQQDLLLVSLHFDRARICLFHKAYQQGADSLDIVRHAIEDPESFATTSVALNDKLAVETARDSLAAELYLQAGRLPEATEAFEKLNADMDNSAIESFHQARLADKSGDWDQALERLNAYFESRSSQAGEAPYELLEHVLQQKLGDEQGSAEIGRRLSQLVRDDPSNDALAMSVVRKLRPREQHARIVELLRPFVADSVSVEALEFLLDAEIQLGAPGPIFASLVQLAKKWERISGRWVLPGSTAVENLVNNRELLQKVLSEAQDRLEDRRRPMLADESFTIAQVCLRAKDFETADKFFEHAWKHTRDETAKDQRQIIWAEECYFADHLAPAVAGFEHALSLSDVDVEGTTELLLIALELDGQTDRALSTVERALERIPDAPGLALRRAWIYLHSGQADLAIDAYRSVLQTFGNRYDSEGLRQVVKSSRMALSGLYVEQEDATAASELLLEVLDEYPGDVGAMNDLGYLWADEGIHLNRALQMIEQAVAAEPKNPAYLDSLGWIYFRLQRIHDALPPLLKAVEIMDAPDGVILDHLGDVYNALDDPENAVAVWTQAVRQFTESEGGDDAQRVRAKIDSVQPRNAGE